METDQAHITSALVLEGGGMRGVFTSGVLDAFMKHNVYFPYTVAVSAGACNGMSYISRQPRRARASNIDLLVRYDYLSLKNLILQGSIFDPVLLYDRFPNELLPFDYDTYFRHAATFEMVTTNCLTGRAEYLSETRDRQRALDIVRASSSLPYVSHVALVDDTPMLDGGIVDSIPVLHALGRGFSHAVVVCTRNRGYRSAEHDYKQPRFIYHQYPRLRVALSHRNRVYNQQLELVERLEDEGRISCIRPQRPMEVGRMEKDPAKLERLYQEGFHEGERYIEREMKQ
ncbi:MAG: patatin family protein [Prevotella sp.]|nr:patatin family protein [Prevotella sp.]